MDPVTMGAAIRRVKSIPTTAATIALEAAESAEASAALAQQHSYGVSVSGTKLVFTANTEEQE